MDKSVTLEQVIGFLLGTTLFEDLDPSELSQIVHVMQIQRVRAGHNVFTEGDVGDAWYVLYEGEAQVTKENPFGPDRSIAMLGPHACFGEMAILDNSTRSASVRAVHDITLLRFPRGPFVGLLHEGSLAAFKLVYGMARLLSQRQRSLTQQLSDILVEPAAAGARKPIRRNLGALLDSYAVSE